VAEREQNRSVFELRPMNLADILDAIVRIYRRNFWQLIGICAVVLAPLGVLQVVASTEIFSLAMAEPSGGLPDIFSGVGLTGLVVYVLVLVLTTPLMQAAVAKAVAEQYLGSRTSIKAVYRFALRKWWTLLWVIFVAGLIYGGIVVVSVLPLGAVVGMMATGAGDNVALIVIGVLLLLLAMLAVTVASVYVGVKLMFCALAVVLEDAGVMEALRRSWDLSTSHFWRVAGTMGLLYVMMGMAQSMVVWPVQLGATVIMGEDMAHVAYALSQGLAGVMQLLLEPLLITGTVLVYYDLRIRKEGFDLVAMADAIGEPDLAARTETGEAAPALFGAAPAHDEETVDEPRDHDQLP